MIRRRTRAFSLPEVMLAIFILGIGLVAVAALFPAGIAQQQQSSDDIMGPVVANNALSILRTKLAPEDFGTFEEFGPTTLLRPTIDGDWPWLRPAFIFGGGTLPAIDIFNGSGSATDESADMAPGIPTGIPYDTSRYGAVPPDIRITQRERYYPMQSAKVGVVPERVPQYYWDCMFRRFQGRILVAIFVYRVMIPGGGDLIYRVPPHPSNTSIPPLPVHVDLTDTSVGLPWAGEPWDADADLTTPDVIEPLTQIPDTGPDQTYDPADQEQSWQAAGQWILDQNNNVYRVLAGRRNEREGPVELARPIPVMPGLPSYYFGPAASQAGEDVVTDIWFIPTEVEVLTGSMGSPTTPATLTPVYVTVKEL